MAVCVCPRMKRERKIDAFWILGVYYNGDERSPVSVRLVLNVQWFDSKPEMRLNCQCEGRITLRNIKVVVVAVSEFYIE